MDRLVTVRGDANLLATGKEIDNQTCAKVGLSCARRSLNKEVAVVERVRHPRYGKTVQRTKKLYVHDAEDTAKVGDRVRVQETRPLSKLKRWRLTEVVERAR